MEFIIIVAVSFLLYFMNRMAIKTAINSQNEELTREINKKILQNRKLDELYGRDSGNPIEQIAKAIQDVEKSKRNFE
tara:strand:+ start:105 stop:335 length:231 start_codon:yes stop_codon:yes gene_type:complete